MRQKIQPGLMADFLTPEEHANAMKDHTDFLLRVLGKNAIFKRQIFSAAVDANGVIQLPATCPDGFIWEVRALSASAAIADRAKITLNAFLNNISDINNLTGSFNNLALAFGPNQGWTYFPSKAVVIHQSEALILSNLKGDGTLGTALTVGAEVNFQVAVIEVPFSHEAQLLM